MLMLFETDADVLGLGAGIESAVYSELNSEKAGGHGRWISPGICLQKSE